MEQSSQLQSFFEFLWEGLNGYAYIATKEPVTSPDAEVEWNQLFFSYPEDVIRLEDAVIQLSKSKEVYIGPALYSTAKADKEHIYATNVLWTEFDGNIPTDESFPCPPSLRIESSGQGHQHVYWKLAEPCYDVETIEAYNRRITYALSADSSAWDATQVLRPPGTHNYKRDKAVTLISQAGFRYAFDDFQSLPEPPELADYDSWQQGDLPDITEVVLKYAFTPQMRKVYTANVDQINEMYPQEKRSGALMQLAYFGCELGMSDPEVMSLIMNADARWRKFTERTDRLKRLAHIVSVARYKHPYVIADAPAEDFQALVFDYVSLIESEIEIDWVLKLNEERGMLYEQGTMMLTGPSGLGKTQVSLQFAIHLALGKDYLGYKIEKPRKMLMLSLEMGHPDLKQFISTMDKDVTDEEREQLRENLILVPHGEPWGLDTNGGQDNLKRLLDLLRPDGLIVDSVQSATQGDVSSEKVAKNLMGFNDHILRNYDMFTWFIHHMRKSQGDNKAPQSADDVYGSQILFNRSSSVYGLFKGSQGNLKIKNLKMRMSSTEPDYTIRRGEHLTFVRDVTPLQGGVVKQIEYKPPIEVAGPNLTDFNSGNLQL